MNDAQRDRTMSDPSKIESAEDLADVPQTDEPKQSSNRREMIRGLAALGIGGAVFQRALASQAEDSPMKPTAEMVAQAEWVAGVELTDEQREQAASAVDRNQQRAQRIRDLEIDYDVAPATILHIGTPPQDNGPPSRTAAPVEWTAPVKPDKSDDLAFMPVTELSALLRTRQVSSVELTKLYLARLTEHNELLNCVVNLTEELALTQAERADREIASGRYRGPLHGVPWGAKDLIAYPGYKTTWGSSHYRDRTLETKATVADRLDQAGAVLVAKLALGTLAWGDRWFNGMTKNPWNPKEGSSGSSAGSASATVAGLVGFSLGSETLGSIVSPSRRCGASGLRPTFGRVSRWGCMTLAWTMDKIGPICRSMEDCALVFSAIHGRDDLDAAAINAPFNWPPQTDRIKRVGYLENEGAIEKREELQALKDLGVELKPIKLPHDFPVSEITMVLNTESATNFDHYTKRGETEGPNRWPPIFRAAQFTPAIDYIQANRARKMLMAKMEDVFREVDCYVSGSDLAITNLTGHPSIVMPFGKTKRRGAEVPGSVVITGRLYDDERLVALGRKLQLATGHHLPRPDLTPPKEDDQATGAKDE